MIIILLDLEDLIVKKSEIDLAFKKIDNRVISSLKHSSDVSLPIIRSNFKMKFIKSRYDFIRRNLNQLNRLSMFIWKSLYVLLMMVYNVSLLKL